MYVVIYEKYCMVTYERIFVFGHNRLRWLYVVVDVCPGAISGVVFLHQIIFSL